MYKYLQDDNGQSTLKKVKCQRACKFCRKSHTTCEDTRPCQRCIKRDIAQLCLQDEADQLAQQAAQQQQQQLAAAAAAGNDGKTVPAKRRGYSSSSLEGERPAQRPSINQNASQFLDNGNAGQNANVAAPNTNPSSSLTPGQGGAPPSNSSAGTGNAGDGQTPSPMPPPPGTSQGSETLARQGMMHSPQDTFRPESMATFDQEMTSPLATTGRLPQWYEATFGQAGAERAPPGQTQGGQQQQQQPPPQQQGQQQGLVQGTSTPEGFSWSALVEGLINPSSTQSPGGTEFAWLNNNAATPNGRNIATSNSGAMASASPGGGIKPVESSMSPDTSNASNPDGPVMPYNYTFGYSRLKTWANTVGDPTVTSRVNSATDRFKTILHGCLSQYSEDQIINHEVQFLTYVRNWATYCDMIPVPACIWRRTGEVYAANKRMLQLMDMTPQTFRAGKQAMYNVLDPRSFVDYWEDYASQVLHHLSDRSSFDTVVPVAMSNRPGEKTHLMTGNITFDTIGLPLVGTAVFTPLAAPSRPQQETTIDVQVGGTPLNPVIRPISLSSLRYLWMV